MSLRIIAGEFRGRRIQSPEGRSTRPTRQEVREAWFNVLGDRIVGGRVLDLFAGSGALGLEALSRGASAACFVESSRTGLAVLRRNIEDLGAGSRSEVLGVDALGWVSNLERGRCWDVVLADPPYASGAAVQLAVTFAQSPFAGILSVEHGLGVDFPMEPHWQRRYGETVLSMFLDPMEGATSG